MTSPCRPDIPSHPLRAGLAAFAAWRPRARFAAAALTAGVALAQSTLPPAGPLLPESALPAYESDVDHAGLIGSWNKASLARGQAVYQAVCHSCHGDLNLPGSLPDALRFSTGKFQHGGDPHTMYRTITRGWRLMPPQVQLVPQEKYDVIHYIRETFLAPHNPAQLFAVTPAYLATLPRGTTRGPEPTERAPWREMDYGPMLIGTFEVADAARRAAAADLPTGRADVVPPDTNLAYKGIALQLDDTAGGIAAGNAWVVFEHDTLRLAGAWTGAGFIDWHGINFDGRHVVRPRTVGDLHVQLDDGPGWADPRTGGFADARIVGVDGRRFGPLPREWARFRGLHRSGRQTVISYSVGAAAVLEAYSLERLGNTPVFVRTLNVGRSSHDLTLRVTRAEAAVALRLTEGAAPLALGRDERFVTLRIPAAATPLRLALRLARPGTAGLEELSRRAPAPAELASMVRGGERRWRETVETEIVASPATGALAWERLTLPQANPWRARVRASCFDFLPGGDAAVLGTWDGDVWRVDGLAGGTKLRWRRIADGLFQPLGLKTKGNEIFVTCRDQLVALRDLNGDGEADFYECINSDHQVTEHFHEFAMGLQTDAAGNFYYAKSARHARTPLVPQHGTLLKVSADGARTEILAHGFRAANGVCLNPDGTFFVTDQEGHWMPANRVNRVTAAGGFFGNMWSYGAPADSSDAAMNPPLCWIDKGFDRSPAELLWVKGNAWGALDGALLNISYGRGIIERVLIDRSAGVEQGAVTALPVPEFPTGIMRGRVHPVDAQLYLCGLSAWATSQTLQEGGFYRVRPTGQPLHLPAGWKVRPGGLEIAFTAPLDPAVTRELDRFVLSTWDLRRSEKYGSPRVGEQRVPVTAAALVDARTLRLEIPQLAPAAGFELRLRLRSATGQEFAPLLHGTLHAVPRAGQSD